MSEYQYYEFLAIDHPLDADEQSKMRSLSTRARITATSFVNEYHWGDFRGDPTRLMERYYDAHLYVANWGTHRVMLRLPGDDLLDPDVVEDYCVGEQFSARITNGFTVLDFTSEDDAGDFDHDAEALLSTIVGVRAELAAGDLRSLYIGWLAAYGGWERDEYAFDRDADDDLEPPVPPGLTTLTAAQQALADFLRLDEDLLAVAAQTSPPLKDVADDPGEVAAWVTRLPVATKNRLLALVIRGDVTRVRMEVMRRFREDTAPTARPLAPRRTIADLLDDTARRRAERERRLADQHAEAEARRASARTLVRERRLDGLAGEEDTAWSRVDTMIATRKPADYDAAVTLLTDLQALAEREERHYTFTQRVTALRRTHARKPSLIERLNRAGF